MRITEDRFPIREPRSQFMSQMNNFLLDLGEIYGLETIKVKMQSRAVDEHVQLNAVYFKKIWWGRKMPLVKIMVRLPINQMKKGNPGIWIQINENAPHKDALLSLAKEKISHFFRSIGENTKRFTRNISEVDMEASIFGVQLEFA